MDIIKYNSIFNYKHVSSLKKIKYKYSDDFEEYISVLKELYFKKLPIYDFSGEKLGFLTSTHYGNRVKYKVAETD